MSKLEELIEEYMEFEENIDDENKDDIEKLNEMGHEIDHMVYHEEFTIVYNKDTDDEEVVALIIADEDDNENFLIPVYTSEEEARKAIEVFVDESGENNFACDKAVGNAIVAAYSEDEDFLGLAINAPQCDFVIFSEHVHDCCE